MDNNQKDKILSQIEELITYGSSDFKIEPTLIKYLSLEDLISIRERLKEQNRNLKDEDRKWLEQFIKDE